MNLYNFHLTKLSKWRTYVYLHFFRGVVAESEDVIKAAMDGLGKNGFINYYGLQVQNQEFSLCSRTYFTVISEAHQVYLLCVVSALEVVQYQPTSLELLCLEENGKLL